MRSKETALNYICSLFTPIDEETEKILIQMLQARRVKLNHEKARRMMAEIPKYDMDLHAIGTSAHANYDERKDDDEAMEKDERLSTFEKLGKSHLDELHDKQEEERQLQKFELEKDTGQHALKDFLIKPNPGPYDVEEDPEDTMYPLHYYDNDDGFWDDWIDQRHAQFDSAGWITRRRFMKH